MATPNPGFQPNFFSSHSVLLNHPIDEVFQFIGTHKGQERVTKLSALCTRCELLERDTVSIPQATALGDTHVRTQPSALGADTQTSEAPTRQLPRQAFSMTEIVPVLFGLIQKSVNINGTVTWDEDAKVSLYESVAGSNIFTWKLRVFEEEDGKTRVSERIEGHCPGLLRSIVQKETTKGHVYVSLIVIFTVPDHAF